MPKVSKIQTNFNAGEVSQNVLGRVDSDRYDTALLTCQNYLPILQGPIIRRPGTKYVTNVKDSTQPGMLIPFEVSATQSYVIEMGNLYARFYTQDGQLLANQSSVQIAGTLYDPVFFPSTNVSPWSLGTFNSVRDSNLNGINGESISSTTTLTGSSTLELVTPYAYADVSLIRWAQQNDTMYLFHPNYPPYKLQRRGAVYWDIKPVLFREGPYLAFNSHDYTGDNANVWLQAGGSAGNKPGSGFVTTLNTGSSNLISATAISGSSMQVTTASPHQFSTGDKVFVSGVVGPTVLNNTTLGSGNDFYIASVVDTTHIILLGSITSGVGYVGSGVIRPALFTLNDQNRYFSISDGGVRYWGKIMNSSASNFLAGKVACVFSVAMPDTNPCQAWQLGSWYASSYPSVASFHQNRLFMSGIPAYPMEIDASKSGDYENMAASGSNYQVSDANALSFNLTSAEVNPVYWMKSSAQGLLAGSLTGEWQITPNTQSGALTPTNLTAQQIASFGSANVDAVQYTNAVVYVQKAQRRLREMNYFFQVGTFRSTNLSELSEHITLPSISKLIVQRETHPAIWAIRGDGQLVTLTYNRDDFSLKSGMARHVLGGQSDATGTPPTVLSMAIAQASSALYEELWMVVKRTINSSGGGGAPTASSVCTVEYMTRPFNQNDLQEDAYYLDCGSSYDSPVPVSQITNASSCVITATAHGFTASTTVRFYNAVGMASSVVDVNGVTTTSSLINELTFQVASVSANAFKIQDFNGNDINSLPYSTYLGSCVVRKLVSQVTGVTWLAGDMVSVLGDGGILANTTVSTTGVVGLSSPSAKVQIGYPYLSQGQLLRSKDGSAQGTSIGSTRRVNRVAFMLNNVGEISYGPTFQRLVPAEFARGDANQADTAIPLFSGIYRDSIEGEATFDDTICFQQSAPLPGTIQAIVRFYEEQDV